MTGIMKKEIITLVAIVDSVLAANGQDVGKKISTLIEKIVKITVLMARYYL
jgi:hypothetical protein